MIYCVELAVPANTAKTDPCEVLLPTNWGTVTQVWVRWRWGSGNLCGVSLWREGSQVWPSSVDQWFPSNTQELTWQEWYLVPDHPLDFVVKAYNLDDTFPHTVWIAINLQRPSVSANLAKFLEYLTKGG